MKLMLVTSVAIAVGAMQMTPAAARAPSANATSGAATRISASQSPIPSPTNIRSARARPQPPPVVLYLPTPTPTPAPPRNRLRSEDGSLDTWIGTYSDCLASTPLPGYAAIDTCIPERTYFIGHNPGPFAPLMLMGAGNVINWWDGTGTLHRFRIVDAHDVAQSAGAAAHAPPGIGAQFQTCATPDGSILRIVDAVEE